MMVGTRRFIALVVANAALVVATSAFAKTPGTTYCYRDICHRVKTITETAAETGKSVHVVASHYDVPWRDRFNPSLLTSSGETFRALDAETAASPIYPDGTRLLVYAPASGAAAVVRVNDAGPYWSGRVLDVSRGAAERLGFYRRGIAHLVVVVLSAPTLAEARHEAGRTYAPVPGFMGVFPSLQEAKASWESRPEAIAEAGREPEREPPRAERVVIIESGDAKPATAGRAAAAGASSEKRTRVVLKPVKQRRPHLLAALAKRNARVAQDTKSKPKSTKR